MNNSIYRDFAIRLYMNPRYGTKMGPTRTNPFLFNGSISFLQGAEKQYVDLADFDNLDRSFSKTTAKDLLPLVDQIARADLGYDGTSNADFVAGQVFELKKEKDHRFGFVAVSMINWKGSFFLAEGDEMIICESVRFRFCQNSNARGKSPDYLGTNVDLKSSMAAPSSTEQQSEPTTDFLNRLQERAQQRTN